MNFEQVQKYSENLMSYMNTYKTEWQTISEFICPHRGRFDNSSPKFRATNYKKFINSTAAIALNTLTAGLLTGVAAPNRNWFFPVKREGKAAGVKTLTDGDLWLEEHQETILQGCALSNFYSSLKEMYEEGAVFGPSLAVIYPDNESIFRIETLTVGTYAVALDARGHAAAATHFIYKTVGDIIAEYDEKFIPQKIKDEFKNGAIDKSYKIWHMILPEKQYENGKGEDFIGIFWIDGEKSYLSLEKFPYNPLLYYRWAKTESSDLFGYGIGKQILGDIKALAKLEEDKYLGVDLITFRPVQYNSARVQGKMNLNPKGQTEFIGDTPAIVPIDVASPQLNELSNLVSQIEGRIYKSFYYDIFLAMLSSTREKTAREVDSMEAEKILMIGPMYENIKYDLLLPFLRAATKIAISGGFLSKPPDELKNLLNVDFDTTVAQVQKSRTVDNTDAFFVRLTTLAQAGKPAVMDWINEDNYVLDLREKLSVQPSLLKQSSEVSTLREAQAAQQSAQAQAASLQQMVATAKEASAIDPEKLSELGV